MGKRHRKQRAAEKAAARWLGYRETELGELRRQESKAEVRRRFLRREENRLRLEREILERLERRAVEDIQAQEDRRIFSEINLIINPPQPPTIWERL